MPNPEGFKYEKLSHEKAKLQPIFTHEKLPHQEEKLQPMPEEDTTISERIVKKKEDEEQRLKIDQAELEKALVKDIEKVTPGHKKEGVKAKATPSKSMETHKEYALSDTRPANVQKNIQLANKSVGEDVKNMLGDKIGGRFVS